MNSTLFRRIRLKTLPRKVGERIKRAILTYVTAYKTNRLIVFLTPGCELRAGGVLTISAFYRESMALKKLHGSRVALCTIPGDPFFLKYTWFENQNYILDLPLLLKCCRRLDYLQLHIPEYAVNRVLDWLEATAPQLKRDVRELHLNVLLQNIDLIAGQNVAALTRFGRVTCTTAHEAYSNQTTREAVGVSLHRLSTCNGPERYSVSPYETKEDLMVVSHDAHPLKERVLGQIAQAFPNLKIEIIRDLTFEEYLAVVRRAKWGLTFGEGLDSYFVDPTFSGGVSFAVFNERFFTPSFADLENVYASWEKLVDNIVSDMRRLDEAESYKQCWRRSYEILSGLYSTEQFRKNLQMFYRGEYTFP